MQADPERPWIPRLGTNRSDSMRLRGCREPECPVLAARLRGRAPARLRHHARAPSAMIRSCGAGVPRGRAGRDDHFQADGRRPGWGARSRPARSSSDSPPRPGERPVRGEGNGERGSEVHHDGPHDLVGGGGRGRRRDEQDAARAGAIPPSTWGLGLDLRPHAGHGLQGPGMSERRTVRRPASRGRCVTPCST